MEISIEDIQKRFDELPEDLKWAIMGANVDEHIAEIAKKESLNIAQMGQLAFEVNAVMLGFYHPDKFEDAIKASLNLPAEKIKSIVDDVNELILKEVRGQLMDLYAKPNIEREGDEAIFKQAGIEMIEEKEEKTENTASMDRNDMLNKVENPQTIVKETPVFAAEKLTGAFQVPMKKTEYSLSNLTKTGDTKDTEYPKNTLPKNDPYRMPVE